MDFLSGKKMYIGIILSTILSLLGVFGVMDPSTEQFQAIVAVAVAFTGYGATVAIHKAGE